MIKSGCLIIFLCFSFFGFSQTKSLSDTFNIIDAAGKKQGHWIILGKSKSCYKPEQIAEEGNYKDNKKTGVWTTYFCNEKVNSQITFTDGKPVGPAKMFHPNGQIAEEGTWNITHWIGRYKYYNPDGTLQQDLIIDENGNKKAAPK